MRHHGVSIPFLGLLTVFTCTTVLAQTRTTGGGGPTTPPAPPPTTTSNPPTRTTIPNPSIPSLDNSRPIYLRGKVVLEQGMELTEPVPIQRVCGTTVKREGYTDMHGNFNILVGDNSYFQDASESGSSFPGRARPVSERQLWNCEIRAYLPGYTSSSIALAGRDFGDSSSIGNIMLHRISGGEGNSISVTSLKAPDKAKNEYRKALESYQNRKFSDAEKHLAKAVEIYPQYASAWELRGREQEMQQQSDEALKSYEAATAADDKLVGPYIRMAVIYSTRADWNTVLRLTGRAIELAPNTYPDAYLLNGAAHYNLKQFEEAERSANKALSLDKEHRFPRSELLLGSLYQMRGNIPGAAEHLRNFLKLEPKAPEADQINAFLTKYDQQSAAATPAAPVVKP